MVRAAISFGRVPPGDQQHGRERPELDLVARERRLACGLVADLVVDDRGVSARRLRDGDGLRRCLGVDLMSTKTSPLAEVRP